jgi:hypothetical protein
MMNRQYAFAHLAAMMALAVPSVERETLPTSLRPSTGGAAYPKSRNRLKADRRRERRGRR